jgi:Tol biopolymer transport system component
VKKSVLLRHSNFIRFSIMLIFIVPVVASCSNTYGANILATLEEQVTMELLFTPSVTLTRTPTPTPTQTPTITLTTTPTPTAIHLGGGTDQLAIVDDPYFGRFDIIYLVNLNGMGATQLTTSLKDSHPSWSPDGKMLIFNTYRNAGKTLKAQIYLMNADGSNQVQVSTCRDCYGAAWSPDGKQIVYVSHTDGQSEIYIMNTDGSGQTQLTSTVGGEVSDAAWSPDGARIAYTVSFSGGKASQIFVINADGSQRTQLTYNSGRNYSPAWSPDGKLIAFTYASSWVTPDVWDIFLMNHDGTGQTRLTHASQTVKGEGCYNPDWSPNGTYISAICGVFDRVWGTVHVISVAEQVNIDTKVYVRNSNNSKAVWQP